MANFSTKSELIKEYFNILSAYVDVVVPYIIYKYKSRKLFPNNQDIINILKNEFNNYIKSLGIELELLNFISKNERSLWYEDIIRYCYNSSENRKKGINYMKELFDSLDIALDLERAYKFNIPNNDPKYLQEDDIENNIAYIKGISFDAVREFIIDECIYDDKHFSDCFSKAKALDVNAKENIDLFGVFEGNNNIKIILPKIKDEVSAFINIHELVHYAILERKDEICNDDIVYEEDIPIFYELLYKKNKEKSFGNIDLHTTDIALMLLEDYNEEPFEVQIEKVKLMK